MSESFKELRSKLIERVKEKIQGVLDEMVITLKDEQEGEFVYASPEWVKIRRSIELRSYLKGLEVHMKYGSEEHDKCPLHFVYEEETSITEVFTKNNTVVIKGDFAITIRPKIPETEE